MAKKLSEFLEEIKANTNAVINLTTGGSPHMTIEERMRPATRFKPEVASLNMGSMNYAKYNPAKKSFVFEFVFPNPFSEIVHIVQAMNEVGTKPELECFDTGHVGNSYPLIDMGLLHAPYQYSLIMGVVGGIPPTVPSLVSMVQLLPPQSEWEIIGISLDQWRLVAAAIGFGGNIRVGLEDNFYLSKGVMTSSNGDLVEKAARMVRDQGREPATVEECRARLKLVNR